MATDDLINKLTSDLKPVKRLPPVSLRVAVVTVATIAILAAAVFGVTHGPRPDLSQKIDTMGYAAQVASFFIAGLCAAFAAFKLSIPDTKIRPLTYAAIGLASAIWGFQILTLVLDGGISHIDVAERNCLTDLSLFMIAPLGVIGFMMTRGAPIWRGWAGYAMVLSVGSFSAIAMRFLCPNDSPAHLLVWHFLPVIVFSIAGIFLGKILLKSNPAKI